MIDVTRNFKEKQSKGNILGLSQIFFAMRGNNWRGLQNFVKLCLVIKFFLHVDGSRIVLDEIDSLLGNNCVWSFL